MAIKSGAHAAIHTAAVAAAGVSASPIPFSDSALLIPIQTTIIATIYKLYDEEVTEGVITGALKATATSVVGKGVAGNLLKLIPGIGSVAGAAINGSVAVSLTEFIGFGVANAFENKTEDRTIDLMEILNDIIFNFNKKKA